MIDFPAGLSPETIDSINREAFNSVVKHGDHSMLNPEIPLGERLAILVEEVGEVATAMNYDQGGKREDLRKELLQVAAMAASWAQVMGDERYTNRV